MAPTRVLIFPVPRLLHDILRGVLTDDPGVQLVELPAGAAGIVEAAELAAADVVIAGERDAGRESAFQLLISRPRSRALAVSDDGHTGVLYELRPHRRPIGDLSVGSIRSLLRAAPISVELMLDDTAQRSAP